MANFIIPTHNTLGKKTLGITHKELSLWKLYCLVPVSKIYGAHKICMSVNTYNYVTCLENGGYMSVGSFAHSSQTV